jgi:hypothetical protein
MFKLPIKLILPLIALSALVLNACSPAETATPTTAVNAIYTAAAQTIEAQASLATATPQPTATSQPTQTPATSQTASPAPAPSATSLLQNYCDNAVFISDVTIPDHTQVAGGEAFDKTWAFQNTGTCTWSTGYTIEFISGEQMNGNARALTQSVAPQQQVNVTVKLTAPYAPGSHTGYWRLANGKGAKFGQLVSVVIDVPGGATTTATVTPTMASGSATGTPTVTMTSTVTETPTITATPTTP